MPVRLTVCVPDSISNTELLHSQRMNPSNRGHADSRIPKRENYYYWTGDKMDAEDSLAALRISRGPGRSIANNANKA
jgi:hypothetical protein